MDRRATARIYEPLLPEFFPVKLDGASIAVEFVAGCPAGCPSCGARRHPARQALLDAGVALDTRISPRRMLAWLRSMPSFRAGVPLRLGHDADAGLAFEKSAELVDLVGSGHAVAYLTRRPLGAAERAFFARPRHNLLLELVATPGAAAPGGRRDPLALVATAAGLDPGRIHWVIGPLGADGLDEARAVLAALPRGSRLTLKPLGAPDLPGPAAGARAMPAAALHDLEAEAHALGHTVTEFTCREGLARVGRAFFDVDRLTGQADLGRRAFDLLTCSGCPSRVQCHAPLDEAALRRRLSALLPDLGLTARAPPLRTGPHAVSLEVAEPASRGDEAYLAHAVGQAVRVALSSRARGADRLTGAEDLRGDVDGAVLRRWHAAGFLPVSDLNAAAAKILEDLRRRLGDAIPAALAAVPAPDQPRAPEPAPGMR
jgi:hypothetical protein